jgi:hypothetical protein
MSIVTVTTVPASVPVIKQDGLRWWPSSYSKVENSLHPPLSLWERVRVRGP